MARDPLECCLAGVSSAGAVIYIYICYRNYGSAFHFLDLQRKIWGVFLRWPFPSVVGNWQGVWHAKASERVLQYGGPFVAFVLAMAALVIAPFRLRACYAIYLGVSWVLIFSNNYPVCSPGICWRYFRSSCCSRNCAVARGFGIRLRSSVCSSTRSARRALSAGGGLFNEAADERVLVAKTTRAA